MLSMQFGYTGKILRVDLSSGRCRAEELDEKLAKDYIGGRGLGCRLIFNELPQGVDPLGERNKIYLLTGPLNGTQIPFSSKYTAVTKSPLTDSYTRTLSGGHFAADLKYAGYDGLIIEGRAERPTYLFVDGQNVSLRDASHLWGTSTSQAESEIRHELCDPEIRVAAIGPAGENLVRFAAVINQSRAAGRGGLGAVFGSKKLKAIALRGGGQVNIAKPARYAELLGEAYRRVKAHPQTPARIAFGTPGTVAFTHELGVLPVKNYSMSVFPQVDGISGETMRKRIVIHDESCFSCPLPCGKLSVVKDGPYSGTIVEGPQYESIGMLGSNCLIGDIGAVAKANMLCNELGLDTISTGNAIGFAMECFQRGLLDKGQIGRLEPKFGDAQGQFEIIKMIAARRGLGEILAEGVKRAAGIIGGGSEKFAMHVKGLEMASFEPRAAVGMGLLYATASRGACHSMGPTFRQEVEIGLTSPDKKPELVIKNQNHYCLQDSFVLCCFSRYGLDLKMCLDFLEAVTGDGISAAEAEKIANRIYTLERCFNIGEGLFKEADLLPERSLKEPLPDGPARGNTVPLEEMLTRYYGIRGWDAETGIPTEATLEALDLQFAADRIRAAIASARKTSK